MDPQAAAGLDNAAPVSSDAKPSEALNNDDLANKVADLTLSESDVAAPTNGDVSPATAGDDDFKEYVESEDEAESAALESEEQVRSLLSSVKREELLSFATKLVMKDLASPELAELAKAHDQQPEARKVHVRNLPLDLTEHDLKKAMNAFGKVEARVIIKDRFSHHSRGFGFVTYTKKKYATRALEAGQVKINDQTPPIAIQAVRPRRQFFRHQNHNQFQAPHHQGPVAAAAQDSYHHHAAAAAQQQQQQYVIPPHMQQQAMYGGAVAMQQAVAAATGQGAYGGYQQQRGPRGGRGPRRAYQQW